MIDRLYKQSFSVLKKRPFKLWGLSLLAEVLYLAACVGFIGVPAVGFCAGLLLSVSMAMIFLNSYRTGLEPKTSYLFASFRKDRIFRVLGGMAWRQLWIFLWSLIPVAGLVFGVIRSYEYRVVPYILMTREDIKPTDAIRISKQETMGCKGKMFGADMLLFAISFGVLLLLSPLCLIPRLGGLFKIMLYIVSFVLRLFASLFGSILHAAFSVEIQSRRAAARQQPSVPAQPAPAAPEMLAQPEQTPEPLEKTQPAARRCPHCGAPVTAQGAVFCTTCGGRLNGE